MLRLLPDDPEIVDADIIVTSEFSRSQRFDQCTFYITDIPLDTTGDAQIYIQRSHLQYVQNVTRRDLLLIGHNFNGDVYCV